MATTSAGVTAQAAQADVPDAKDGAAPECECDRKRKPEGDANGPPPDKRPGGAAPAVARSNATPEEGSAVGPELRNYCSATRGLHPTVALSAVHCIGSVRTTTTKKTLKDGRVVRRTKVVLVCVCAGRGTDTCEAWLALPEASDFNVDFLGDLSYYNGGEICTAGEQDGGGQRGEQGEQGDHGPACFRAGPDGREASDDRQGPAQLAANFVAKASPVVSKFVVWAAAMCRESVGDFLARLRDVILRMDGLVHHQGHNFPAVVVMLFPLYAHLDLRKVLAIIPHVVGYWEEQFCLEENHLHCMYAFSVLTSLALMMKDSARLQAAVEQADHVGECRPFNLPRAVLAALAVTSTSTADLAAMAVGPAARASGSS